MICSIISDMEMNPKFETRLRAEINALTDIYTQVDFLVGDLSGVERQAHKIISVFSDKSYYINCFTVSTDPAKKNDAFVPDAIDMVKPECVAAWRNRWMMKRSEVAIVCMSDRSMLPPPDDIHRMRIIDISR